MVGIQRTFASLLYGVMSMLYNGHVLTVRKKKKPKEFSRRKWPVVTTQLGSPVLVTGGLSATECLPSLLEWSGEHTDLVGSLEGVMQ